MPGDVVGVDVGEALSFLDLVWFGYASPDARCFSVVHIGGNRVGYRHFCVERDLGELRNRVEEYLGRNLAKWASNGVHAYFQVLPLAEKPRQGRGSSRDVRVGQWLWCDLDYKQAVEKPEFQGCKEGEDHSLECYYEDSGKWIHVSRPRLPEVLQQVRDRLGIEPTVVVDSGAGYHLYFKLSSEVEAIKLAKLEAKLVDLLGGDPQSKDLARILRLPGSINPRVNRPVSVVYTSTSAVDPEHLEEALAGARELEETPRERPRESPLRELRELSDTDILRIVEILKEAYRPGYRQYLILYLSGWLAKARISPLSAVKIAKALYDSIQDQDPLRARLSAVVYSYKKAGIDIDSYAGEIENLTGVKPYGLEKEIREEEVKGKSGLQEKLEEVLGEERALAIIHELSEILGTLSPYRDSVIEILDYEKQLYAVANLRKLVIVRAKRDGNTFRYKERVAVVAPTRVVVYDNPIGGVRKYEVTFEGSTLRRPLVVGPALIEEIADRVKAEGLVYHSRLWLDTLNAIVNAFIRKGKAEIKTEIESPGFYLVDGKVVAVRYDVLEPDKQRLRESLMLLNELAETWFKHCVERFSTIVKWGVVAPFGYVLKQKGRWIRWLYLYGDSGTGKTTLGRCVLRIWGLDSKHEKTGASVDTIPRLGHVLSQSTFPMLVNEPGNALSKEDVIEAIKNAVDTQLVRGKYHRGTYVEIPALAPIMFTSNRVYPQDDALRRRLLVLSFSFGDKIPIDKQREFKERVEPRLQVLSEIGRCISWLAVNSPSILELEPLEAGKQLLAKCYEIAGLGTPQWLELAYEEEADPQSFIIEEFVERFRKLVNDLFARYVSRVVEHEVDSGRVVAVSPDGYDLKRRLELLLEKNMLPGARLRNGEVVILAPLLGALGFENTVNLKSLAEVLGFEYKRVKIGGGVTWGAVTRLSRLAELLLD